MDECRMFCQPEWKSDRVGISVTYDRSVLFYDLLPYYHGINPFPNDKFYSSKLKEFADDNF